jgi:hypothetical protein
LHSAFLAAGTKGDVDPSKLEQDFLDRACACPHFRGHSEQALNKAQVGCTLAISQGPILADSDEALGQRVEQKAVDKLDGTDGGLF